MPSEDQRVGLKHPGLMLKYSTFKNLATMAALREDLETAMEFYLEVKQVYPGIGQFYAAKLVFLIKVNNTALFFS